MASGPEFTGNEAPTTDAAPPTLRELEHARRENVELRSQLATLLQQTDELRRQERARSEELERAQAQVVELRRQLEALAAQRAAAARGSQAGLGAPMSPAVAARGTAQVVPSAVPPATPSTTLSAGETRAWERIGATKPQPKSTRGGSAAPVALATCAPEKALPLSSLRRGFVEVGGLNLFYAEAGAPDAPPLLMLHGLMGSTFIWQRVWPQLATRFRVIMPDLPGHGYSDKRDDFSMSFLELEKVMIGFADALGLGRFNLVGISFGGAVAMLVAARLTERVAKLVLADSACYPFAMPLKGRVAVLPVIGELIVKYLYRRSMVAAFVHGDVYHDPSAAPELEVDTMYAHFDSPGGRASIYRVMREMADLGWLRPRIRHIRSPTLIVWGANDRVFPVTLVPRMKEDIPGTRTAVIEQCGHQPMTEKPDEFVRIISAFL